MAKEVEEAHISRRCKRCGCGYSLTSFRVKDGIRWNGMDCSIAICPDCNKTQFFVWPKGKAKPINLQFAL